MQLTAEREVEWIGAVKTYASVTLNSGDVFGCFALMRYELLQDVCCGLMCFYRNCCSHAQTQNNHTVSVLNLKNDRSEDKRDILQ